MERGENMAYSEAQKRATIKYMKKLKRIPLDVKPEEYELIKQYAKKLGKPVNTALKELIFEKIRKEEEKEK